MQSFLLPSSSASSSPQQPQQRQYGWRRSSSNSWFLLWIGTTIIVSCLLPILLVDAQQVQKKKNKSKETSKQQSSPSSSSSSSSTTTTSGTQRSGNIDLFDAETMAYYLSYTPGSSAVAASPPPVHDFDVVVLYYAQWCSNCRALSPIYIRIAELLAAGTVDSHLIVGYFDCEANREHATLCSKAGITHYPTLQFISLSGQSLPSGLGLFGNTGISGGASSSTLPSHVTQFAGNWQQGEAILDWIKAMSFLSRYHRAAWGQRLRSWLFGGGKRKSASSAATAGGAEADALPIGIPHVAAMERQVVTMQKDATDARSLAARSEEFITAMLTPTMLAGTSGTSTMVDAYGANYTDVFAYLTQNDAWDANGEDRTSMHSTVAWVLRTCTAEAVLDVCHRLSLQITEEWVARQPIPDVDYITDEQLSHFTSDTTEMMKQAEPFCLKVDDCILQDFASDECRPSTCPFHDQVRCRYLTACLTNRLLNDYAEALNVSLSNNNNQRPDQDHYQGPSKTTTSSSKNEETQRTRKWGLF